MARSHSELAIKALATIAQRGKSESARVAAAQVLLDRGWGKPTQPISGEEDGPPIKFTTIELVGVIPTDKDAE